MRRSTTGLPGIVAQANVMAAKLHRAEKPRNFDEGGRLV
jgi:hypothetical protein